MDENSFLNKMHDAVYNHRLKALFVSLQMDAGNTANHYYEDYCGFQLLMSYTTSYDSKLLEQAIRKFDYIQPEDYKYVRAISYYGKAIAYAYYQTGDGFSEAYKWLKRLIDISIYIGTDRPDFIKELQTEAKHLKQDIIAWDKELNPYMYYIRSFRDWWSE